jgi:hypothetical protein
MTSAVYVCRLLMLFIGITATTAQIRVKVLHRKNVAVVRMNNIQAVVELVQKLMITNPKCVRNNVFQVVFANLWIMFARITALIVLVSRESNVRSGWIKFRISLL